MDSASHSLAPEQQHAPLQTNEPVSDPIVGIDLGTTNSLVAYCGASGPRILGGGRDGVLLPSVVRYRSDGGVTVGQLARDERVQHAAETIANSKRFMGRSFDEARASVASGGASLSNGPRGLAAFRVHARVVTPQEVAAEILRELRLIAQADLGVSVTRAVITVPAYFDDAQRQATRDAARLAGLDPLRIVNEPTAAALAYGLGHARRAERVAVFDLGGGTFDVTLLEIVPGTDLGTGADCFHVLATAGDTALGGIDVDQAIVAQWLDRGASAPSTPNEHAAMLAAAERAKIALEHLDRVTVEAVAAGGVSKLTLTHDELAAACAPLIARALALCARVLRDGATATAELDRVVLVGGSSRLKCVRAAVTTFFAVEPYLALDPDRVIALGAAVQAAILAGNRRDLLLLDVIPLSLGIETMGGAVAKLIMRNSPIPAKAHEHFSTSKDGQTSVRIHVVQGERELVAHCRSLGVFDLRGIPPMPAGIPQIEVSFLVDQNGVLSVRAVEKRSATVASIQVVPSYGLTSEEVDQIERDSVAHARDDMTLHRVIDLRVHAELDLKWISEAIERVRGELASDYLTSLEAAMALVRARCEAAARDPRSIDADAFHRAKQALDELSMRLHETSIAHTLRRA